MQYFPIYKKGIFLENGPKYINAGFYVLLSSSLNLYKS
jgi:hypothetical protein